MDRIRNQKYYSKMFLVELFKSYTIYDQKLGLSNYSLIKVNSLLRQSRVAIRKGIIEANDLSTSSISNINTLIRRLPGLPLDLYDFLCFKTLKIKI